MKTILTTLCLLVGLSAFGQGTAIRSLNGRGTNTSFWGTTTIEGNIVTEADVTFQGTGFLLNATEGIAGPGGRFIGDGSGLTNLIGATNFSSSVTYNFNGKVTYNSVSYNTNLWAGPTNTLILSTNYQDYVTTTDVNITNVGGQLARQNTWATLTISNASAGDITVRSTAAGLRPQGSGTSAAMVVGAGKEGILSFLSRDFKSTNYVTTAQQ